MARALGRIFRYSATIFLVPLLIALIYREPFIHVAAFAVSGFALFLSGLLLNVVKPSRTAFSAREGYVITVLVWLFLSLFGSLPFIITGEIPRFVDAFFETSSGFTTTGSSILFDIEALSHSALFWRSFTHLIGGMGVLVFVFALMPSSGVESVHVMRAEVPGHEFGKLVARLRENSVILYSIYFAMTGVLVVLLLLGGIDVFDALLIAFGTAGTGGFAPKNTSIAHYNSPYVEIVLAIAMIAFGVNFTIYYLFLLGQPKRALKSEELRWFIAVIFTAIALISLALLPHYRSVGTLLRHAFFTVASTISTTGYVTVDYGTWPLFTHLILIAVMIIGSMSGSTGGGFKVSRFALTVKTAFAEIRQARHPRRAVPVFFDGKTTDGIERSILRYLSLYIMLFSFFTLIVSFDLGDIESAVSAVAATFNNIGPGLGEVGPVSNFGGLSDLSKWTLSFAMIAGRLEILPLLIILMPSTWRRHS
jgi:trk system potassium uptake protein TrkH